MKPTDAMKSRLLLLIGALAILSPAFATEYAPASPQFEISVFAIVDEYGVPQQVEIERMPSYVSPSAVSRYVKKHLVAVGAKPGERVRMQFSTDPLLKQNCRSVTPASAYPRTSFPTNGPAGMPPRGMGRGL